MRHVDVRDLHRPPRREHPEGLSEEQVRQGLEGNLCRCTGYQNIVDAVLAAAGEMGDG